MGKIGCSDVDLVCCPFLKVLIGFVHVESMLRGVAQESSHERVGNEKWGAKC